MRRRALGILALGALLLARPAMAQERLLGGWTASTGALVENWSLPTAAIVGSTTGDAMYVRGITQLTLPVAVVAPLGHGWFADAYGAYATSVVRLARPMSDGSTRLTLDGPTDSRVRLVGHLLGDRLTLTAGLSIPTGRTRLEGSQMDALSVVAAPGLGLRTPGLGSGLATSGGFVYATQLGAWGVALGGSYEFRGAYTPSTALEAGLAAGPYRAGGAAHASLAVDRTMGAFRHTLDVSVDAPQGGSLELDLPAGGASLDEDVRLPTVVTGLYQLDVVRGPSRTSLFASLRNKSPYEVGGAQVAGTDRMEVASGAEEALLLGATSTLHVGADGRYQTRSAGERESVVSNGLVGFSTSAAESVGATVGLRVENHRHTLGVEPYAHGQLARMDFGAGWQTATGVGGGLTLSLRF